MGNKDQSYYKYFRGGPPPRCAMVFDKLEELEIRSNVLEDSWMYLAASNSLKKFKLTLCKGVQLDMLMLSKISASYPNLTEVTMYLQLLYIPTFEIAHFIYSFRHLQRFNYIKASINRQCLAELEKVKILLSNDFDVLQCATEEYFCSFIRKS